MKSNIDIIMEIYLVYPYKRSLSVLVDFVNLWRCKLIKSSTKKEKAIISMPSYSFKKIFGTNPREDFKYAAPANSEHFIKYIKIKKVEIK